ncbi:MAG: hypothetical protein IJK89_08440 [Clostridia bacterium]|nr:hypothetical protein [Clostridia bacterium]
MRKRMAFALVIIILVSLCSCGQEKGTKLTVDNFSTYFDVQINRAVSGDLKTGNTSRLGGSGTYTCAGYDAFDIWVIVEPYSENFIYSDVVVQLQLSGSYVGCEDIDASNAAGYTVNDMEPKSFSSEITIQINLGGKGRGSETISVPEGRWISKFGNGTEMYLDDYKILSVTGTVEKA